ncbi:1-acyl-sn-glycerol-3-phosphate acyltransferase-like isoform X2 [Punica granatum]|uniref:1-acyl-sn-glycerol-3-phosphate acyltransferase-like isoform X2 n=1 Tax=Punica granatum TaxID=22663 RepID=A0A6P8BZE3_PUNGR|nr:1-acyl-sn-glycerol-3-phosphate acyltransferase-like isoform X2 [Punica granatum]
MDSDGVSSFLRNRKLESFFSAGPAQDSVEPSTKITVSKNESESKMGAESSYVDDDGWIPVLISWVRIVMCFVSMMFTTFIWAVIMVVLIPWPCQRIKQGNIYGHVTGRMLMWILGNPIKIEGTEYANERAIYISNHASPIDIFLMMWLTPTGTVGIAKKEIIWYPLFGQLYVLASHLRIDRSNPTAAVESMKEGFVHLALQTRRPIVPMVLTGTHLAWRKGSLHVRPAPLTVKYLPPIRTDDWTADRIDDYVRMVHDVYVKHLPESQRPLGLGNSGNSSNS